MIADTATIAPIVTQGLVLIVVSIFGFNQKWQIKAVVKDLVNIKIDNDKAHNKLFEQIDYVNARETLSKALGVVCNHSIDDTPNINELNTFKNIFTEKIIDLAKSTVRTGFDILSRDMFRTYMDNEGREIRGNYDGLPDKFVDIIEPLIFKESEIYYKLILDIIDEPAINGKYDRFVNLTINFLTNELRIITKEWWKYEIKYKTVV